MNLPLLLTLTFNLFSYVDAFGSFNFGNKGSSSSISNKAVEEALAIYEDKYPSSNSDSISKPFWNSWGVPKRDFDGSAVLSEKPNKKIFDVGQNDRKKAFQEIAKLYGTEEALKMTKILPGVLAFDSKNFKPSLNEFVEIFGEEEAKAMVMRNPGLLYVKPENAATSDDLTMQFSYIIAVTRPAGPLLLYGTLSLLMVPVLEGLTGVSRADFLSAIGV